METLRRLTCLTGRRTTDPLDNDSVLDAFHDEVGRLAALSQESFAAVDPDALAPLVVTIRAIPSEISSWDSALVSTIAEFFSGSIALPDLARTVQPVFSTKEDR